jgi:hypothetical protein
MAFVVPEAERADRNTRNTPLHLADPVQAEVHISMLNNHTLVRANVRDEMGEADAYTPAGAAGSDADGGARMDRTPGDGGTATLAAARSCAGEAGERHRGHTHDVNDDDVPEAGGQAHGRVSVEVHILDVTTAVGARTEAAEAQGGGYAHEGAAVHEDAGETSDPVARARTPGDDGEAVDGGDDAEVAEGGAKREAAHDGGDVSSTAPHAGRVRAHAHVQGAAQKRAAVADRTVAADDMLLDDQTVMSSGPALELVVRQALIHLAPHLPSFGWAASQPVVEAGRLHSQRQATARVVMVREAV